jgi:hypothetical protein
MTVRVNKPEFNIREKLKSLDYSHVPYEKMPAGSIIQVKQVIKTDTWSTTGYSAADITGLSLSITPRSAGSKILCRYNLRASSDYWKTYVNLIRESTALFQGATAGIRPTQTSSIVTERTNSNAHGFMHDHSVTFLDSPRTTSTITYKLQGYGRGGSYIMYVNRSVPDRNTTDYDSRCSSNLILMEVAG